MKVSPAKYWRQNNTWQDFVGKTGKVVIATYIRVSSPELQDLLPYSFAIVDIEGQRYEFMGEKGVELKKGDKVELVLRKKMSVSKASLINYGIKMVKI